MPNTPRMSWPYPSEDKDPWFDAFVDLMNAMDSSGYAAREDRNLVVGGGGTVSFVASTGLLTWGSAFQIFSTVKGFQLTISAGNATLQDGELLYVDLVRSPTLGSTLATSVSSTVPSSNTALVLAVRSGSDVVFRFGTKISDGESKNLLGSFGESLLDSQAVTGAATSAVTLDVSGAPAATKKIRVRGWVKHGESGTTRDFLVLMNGVEGVVPTSFTSFQNGVSNQFNRTNFLITPTGLDEIEFEFELDPEFTKNGVNFRRLVKGYAHADDNPPTRTTANFGEAQGFWDNLVDPLTSIEIRSTSQDLPGTLTNSLGVDSYFEAYAVL